VERQYRHANMDDVRDAIRQAVAERHELQVYDIVLIMPGTLPKTSSGKTQRHAARERYLAKSLELVG
jgi:acyl-CoA synthetase (AMP-forming)/AMP-acid ligase II